MASNDDLDAKGTVSWRDHPAAKSLPPTAVGVGGGALLAFILNAEAFAGSLISARPWEGYLAGLIVGTVTAFLVGRFLRRDHAHYATLPFMTRRQRRALVWRNVGSWMPTVLGMVLAAGLGLAMDYSPVVAGVSALGPMLLTYGERRSIYAYARKLAE